VLSHEHLPVDVTAFEVNTFPTLFITHPSAEVYAEHAAKAIHPVPLVVHLGLAF
jgi:hypothetical protein